MHYEFCTLFDRNYLFKGLALHESLRNEVGDFTLWVLCMDDVVRGILEKMQLPGIKLISLAEFEDEDLLRAKATRTEAEYCWTCTPSLPLWLLDHVPSIEAATYLDADLFFFSDPAALYAELDGGSIGITEHRFSPAYESYAQNHGIYNVAFMVFRNDGFARECLEWWRSRCNEWCYDRVEEGKYGDQKYLNDWPERFRGVVVFQDVGVGLAPWNVQSHRIAERGGRILVDEEPLIYYHFHSLVIMGEGKRFRLAPSAYKLRRRRVKLVYWRYIASIRRAMVQTRRVDPAYACGISSERLGPLARSLVTWAREQVGRARRLMRRAGRAAPGRLRTLHASEESVPLEPPAASAADTYESQAVAGHESDPLD